MGKITKIETQKRNKDRVNIYIDNVYAFPLDLEVLYKENLKVGMEIEENVLMKIGKEEDFGRCKNSALKIIERSYKSEKEIFVKLLEKGYDKEVVNKTISFLKEYNFLNDETYVKMYVKDKIKTQGKNKIKYSLLRKGIEEEIINKFLMKVEGEEEKERAYEIALKKYNQLVKREQDKYKLWNKLSMFLGGKGYEYSLIKDVVNSIINEEY